MFSSLKSKIYIPMFKTTQSPSAKYSSFPPFPVLIARANKKNRRSRNGNGGFDQLKIELSAGFQLQDNTGKSVTAFHIARTQNNVLSTPGRFSDLRLTLRLLPIPLWGTVDNSLLGFPIFSDRSRRLQRRDRRGFSPRSRLNISKPTL